MYHFCTQTLFELFNERVISNYILGTACSPDDYSGVAGTLTFGPGETEKKVELSVEDDDMFEEDEHFYIRVSNPR